MQLKLTDHGEIQATTSRFGVDSISSSVLVASYLLTVLKIAPSYMKSRPAFHLKTYIILYNIVQILTCIYLICKISMIKLPVSRFWKCINIIPGTNEDKDFQHIAYTLFWLKVSEFTETIVFILRKKYQQVSFLHVFHHCSSLFIVYHFNNSYNSSAAFFPASINSFVHLIMYTYYLMAATLPREIIDKLTPFKKCITIMQMVQFTFILGQVVVVLCLGCKFPNELLALYSAMIGVIFYKFYDFYRNSYIKKESEKLKGEEDKLKLKNNNNLIKSQ